MGGLTSLQRKVAKLVLGVASDAGFVLAGGAGLVATGQSSRPTSDIDAFSPVATDVGETADVVAQALAAEGYQVHLDRRTETFCRLRITAGSARRRRELMIELARDSQEWPAVETALGPCLSPRELAANKVLALFNRVMTRDLCDVATLAGDCDLEQILEDAKVKDEGFSRQVLAEMIVMVGNEPDLRWPPDVDLAVVRTFGSQLATALEADVPVTGLRPERSIWLPLAEDSPGG